MKKRAIPGILVLSLVLSGLSFSLPAGAAPVPRPSTWAAAVSDTSVGNLYRIETGLYRSAQPTSAGFRELEAMGVKSVLSVSGEDDSAAARGTKLKTFHVPMTAWGLRDGRVLEALKILADPANRPLVIHCQHGADRTGALVALYRVLVQGWDKAEAVREMNEGGFHHSSFWRNLDRYVLGADVASLRGKLSIAGAGPSLREGVASAAAVTLAPPALTTVDP